MAINTLVTIKDSITAFADGHGQLKGRVIFEADDHRSAYITEENTYPLLFVAPIDVAVNRAMNVHTLRVYVYERINDDRLDVWENANDTSLILRDIRVWWNDYGIDDINIVEDPIGQFGCDKELDNLVGYFADIRFEIPSHGRCQVPVDVTLIPSPSCADATQVITDSDGNELYSNSIPSGATETQVIQDSVATLRDSLGVFIGTTNILAEGSEDIVAPDATYTVEYENGRLIQSGSIPSDSTELIQVPNPVTCADATVNVNGVLFDTVASGDTLDIEVRQEQGATLVGSKQGQYFRVDDSPVNINGGLIANVPAEDTLSINVTLNGSNSGTWNSGTQTWEVVSAAASVGATLMKTGQTTSYRTGDDGDLEAGRATSFLVLASNNPFGNTNRFTDELGGSTYTNNIVIDWSTYDGSTVLGYTKNTNGSPVVWNTAIDNCLSLSISTFVSGWRLANRNELSNLINEGAATSVLNYPPFNFTTDVNIWSSTTARYDTSRAFILGSNSTGWVYALPKPTAACHYYAVRTFTVTGTTLT
jgi:hypothetical protein